MISANEIESSTHRDLILSALPARQHTEGETSAGLLAQPTFLYLVPPNRTAWVETFGEHAARRLGELYHRIAYSLLKKHRGRRDGRGGRMIFDRPASAVHYALAYRQALDKMSGGDMALRWNVGIHKGSSEPCQATSSWQIAEGLATLSEDGRILLSHDVVRLVRSHSGTSLGEIRFTSHGPHKIAGATEKIGVFEAGWTQTAPPFC